MSVRQSLATKITADWFSDRQLSPWCRLAGGCAIGWLRSQWRADQARPTSPRNALTHATHPRRWRPC